MPETLFQLSHTIIEDLSAFLRTPSAEITLQQGQPIEVDVDQLSEETGSATALKVHVTATPSSQESVLLPTSVNLLLKQINGNWVLRKISGDIHSAYATLAHPNGSSELKITQHQIYGNDRTPDIPLDNIVSIHANGIGTIDRSRVDIDFTNFNHQVDAAGDHYHFTVSAPSKFARTG